MISDASLSPISIGLFAVAVILAYFFLGGFLWGAGFQPTPRKFVKRAAELLELKEGTVLYDLGSGFGGVVVYVAENYPVNCVGVEVEPFKYWWSSRTIKRHRLEKRVKILKKNLLEVDLSNADAIFIFLSGGTKIMKQLRQKIVREMKPGSKIVSYAHKFDEDWSPTSREGDLRLYVVPDSLSFQ